MDILNFKNYKKLNESVNNLAFSTVVKEVSDYFLQESDFAKNNQIILDDNDNFNIEDANFVVDWYLNIEQHIDFIKNLEVTISNVKGNFNLVIWGEEHDDIKPYNFDAKDLGFTIICEVEIINGSSVSPSDIEIDFRNKTVIVK